MPYNKNHTKAVLAEMKVLTDLVENGVIVYRPASFFGPCDMLILIDGKALKLEVKMINRGQGIRSQRLKDEDFDILACYDSDRDGVYYYSRKEALAGVHGKLRERGGRIRDVIVGCK